MSYKDYSNGFRKEIRRTQLDQIFSKKRQLLLENSQLEKMEEEIAYHELNPKNGLEYLKSMARMSTTSDGIISLIKSQIQQSLYQYLKPEYIEKEQQYFSTFILSNLYYQAIPVHQNLLNYVNALLQQNISMKIAENLCVLLQNVMTDHASIRDILIADYNFVNTILRLWNLHSNPTLRYISYLVSITFKILHNNKANTAFLKLRQYLFRVIKIEIKPQLKQMLKKACLCIYTITLLFPKETADMIIKGQIIQKFIEYLSHFRSKRFAKMILDMLEFLMPIISAQDYNKISSNFLFFLFQNNFQLKQNSQSSQRDLKIQTYILIYKALQNEKMTVKDIINRSYFKNMKDDYQTEDDPETLSILTYIFIHIYLNCSEKDLKQQIEYNVGRIKQVCKNNYDLMNHVHFAQQFFTKSNDTI